MKRKGKFCKRGIVLLITVTLAAVLASPVFAEDTSCATKYPIILAHGMGFYPTDTLPNSFPGIKEALESCGATVYVTQVEPLGTSAEKAEQFVDGYTFNGVEYGNFNEIKATSGASKFNIIGHSQGGLYTRYAISNLGIAPSVASLTTADSPHGGSLIDGIQMKMAQAMPNMSDQLTDAINPYDLSYISQATGDSIEEVAAKMEANTLDLSVDNMKNNFNPNTPDMPGVYYQSFTCAYRKYKVFGSIQSTLAQLIAALNDRLPEKPDPEDGLALAKYIEDGFPGYAGLCYLSGGGFGDGLVQVNAAKWGRFLGTQRGAWYSDGLNHFDAVNINGTTWDAVGYYVNLVKDLKEKGF